MEIRKGCTYMKQSLLLLFSSILSLLTLSGCNQNNPTPGLCFELIEITEEQLYEESTSVIIASPIEKVGVSYFSYGSYSKYPFTKYKLDTKEVIKGNSISYVYLFDDTYSSDSHACTPEEVELNLTYKFYLIEKDGNYFTTSTLQSIYLI